MNKNTIDLELHAENPLDVSRECHMSLELYQNARQTMGELRDWMRTAGISWDFIQHHIDEAQRPKSAVDKAMDSMDDYTTGFGHSLQNKDHNVW